MGEGMCGEGLWPYKLQTPLKLRFTSKMIIFEEALKLKNAIILSYG